MIKITRAGNEIQLKSFRFSGGEIQVVISDTEPLDRRAAYVVEADLKSSVDIMEMLIATDALRRKFGEDFPLHLICPYLPYARQDRVCADGEALSLRVMCDLINAQNYASVTVWDVHSDVAMALLNQAINVPAKTFVSRIPTVATNTVLVSPDAGALKRVSECAKYLKLPVVHAEKHRDVQTGAITDTVVHSEHVGDNDFLIVDDICDGGKTFVELAKKLRPLTTGKINLYVTHGIFSKGLEPFDGLIDTIYCANPWKTEEELRASQPLHCITMSTRLVHVW